MTRREGCDRRTCEAWVRGKALDVAGPQRAEPVDGRGEVEAVLRIYGVLVFLSHGFKGPAGASGSGFWGRRKGARLVSTFGSDTRKEGALTKSRTWMSQYHCIVAGRRDE